MDLKTNTDAGPLICVYSNGDQPLIVGSSIVIPDGYGGLVIAKEKICGILPTGSFTIDAAGLPELGRILRLKPGESPRKPQPISVVLVRYTTFDLRWSARPLITNNVAHGMTYCELSGTASICVNNPVAFYQELLASISKIGKQITPETRKMVNEMTLDQQAHLVIDGMIADSAGAVLAQSKIAPQELGAAFGQIHQSIITEMATRLLSLQATCYALNVDNIPEAKRAPCARCGSPTALTHFGIFRRNLSLLYIRYGTKREGNFCVRCALIQSTLYNSAMLVCGWWGYIGIILTPIYFIQNIFNFCRIAFGPKIAAIGPDDNCLNQENAWPPSPAIWGRETSE